MRVLIDQKQLLVVYKNLAFGVDPYEPTLWFKWGSFVERPAWGPLDSRYFKHVIDRKITAYLLYDIHKRRFIRETNVYL